MSMFCHKDNYLRRIAKFLSSSETFEEFTDSIEFLKQGPAAHGTRAKSVKQEGFA